MSSEVFPRVTIPRQGGDATPYYIERIFFNKYSGLFFIAQFDNDEIKNYVISALLYLSDEGIGTDRHVGNGLFKFEEDKIDFEPITSDYAINLSLYCPSAEIVKNIINDDNVAYEVITRGGWITTPEYNTLRKKYIRMFKEGSMLKIKNTTDGRIVNISPDNSKLPEKAKNIHPIYRVGKSIFLSVNYK
jgi:CRISPR type III-A-associated RAMP protein Csm4